MTNTLSRKSKISRGGMWTLVHLTAVIAFVTGGVLAEASDHEFIQNLMETMTLSDKIGQMAQIDINEMTEDDPLEPGKKRLDMARVKTVIGENGVGSVLNYIQGRPFTPKEMREATMLIQEVAKNFSRPPVIWGLDSVHGANYVHGAILSPQPINIAATFNTSVSYAAGQLASRDTRAVGINWLFSPLMGLAIEPFWSRIYETFGEDPLVVAAMGSNMIAGIQTDLQDGGIPSKAAACAKHFVGYSAPHNGHDRSPAWIPTRHLYQYFVPPWQAAIQEQVLTVMESYSETDGVPNVANPNTLRYLLRQRLGFQGVLVTDYQEILNLKNWHHISRNEQDAVVHSLREGSVDMSMIPHDEVSFHDSVSDGVANGMLVEERINESAERVLKLKSTLNMFHEELVLEDVNLDKIGQDEESGLDMARQSIVLVKNNGALPLNASPAKKILVTGPSSNSLVYQSGGWTGEWQGVSVSEENRFFTYGETVLAAMNATFGESVTYACGVDIMGDDCEDNLDDKDDSSILDQVNEIYGEVKDWVGFGSGPPSNSMERAAALASEVDTVVICIGEESYTEKPGDIRSMDLPAGQYDLISLIKSSTTANVVLVYFGGRPRILRQVEEFADAILLGFLPGPSGGKAVADILSGFVNPGGKLPITWPKYEDAGGSPYFHAVSDQCNRGEENTPLPHFENVPCEVQWPFGFGLSFTHFEYSQLSLSTNRIAYVGSGQSQAKTHSLKVSVSLRNTGSVAGYETVLFFTFDESRSTTPEYKRLRAFEKLFLQPGEERTVTATIPVDSLKFVGPHDDTHFILEDGLQFRIGVGAETDCRSDGEAANLCSDFVSIDTGNDYIAACEAACELWTDSGCAETFKLSGKKCVSMCKDVSTNSNVAKHLGEGEDGWGWNYVGCLESVVWGFQQQQQQQKFDRNGQCGAMITLCRDIFKSKETDQFAHGHNIPVSKTETPMKPTLIALCAGLVASVLVYYSMRGCFEKRGNNEIEFTRVSNEDALTA